MRKIEEQIIAAIKARQNFSGGNTIVLACGDTIGVRLYNSLVAASDGAKIVLSFCDFNTPTTCSRINCLLDALDVPYYAHIVKRVGCFSSRADHKIVARGSLKLQKTGNVWGNV